MSQMATFLLYAGSLLVFYLAMAWLFPYTQWTRYMMGEKAPVPYVDIPLKLWQQHRRSFLTWKFVGVCGVCALIAPVIALSFEKALAAVLVAGLVTSVPIVLIQRRIGQLWRGRARS